MKRNILISLASIMILAGVAWAYTFTHTGPEIDQGVEVGLNVGAATGVIQSDGADTISALTLKTTAADPGVDTALLTEKAIVTLVGSGGGGGCDTLACLTDVSGEGTDGSLLEDQGDGTFVFVDQLTGISFGGFTNDYAVESDSNGVLVSSTMSAAEGRSRDISVNLFNSDTDTEIKDGLAAYTVPVYLDGANLVSSTCSVHTKSASGTTAVEVVRRRVGTEVDMLSTPITIGNEYFASDGVVNTGNDDVATGDRIHFNVTAIQSPAAKGLGCTATFRF